MTAHLLRHSGYGCNAFLGGISGNYGTNFWSHPNGVCVVEADEYDRSFLKLRPDMAVITSMDPDHLDIYGTPAEMEEAFIAFSKRIKPDGWLIAKHGLSRGAELQARHLLTYDLENTAASIHTRNLEVKEGGYCFDVCLREEDGTVWSLRNLRLQAGGLHNVENLLPAIAAARILHIGDEAIRAAVAAYQGVKRRFEYILPPEEGGLVFIDDYAHHPEELQALIRGVRSLFAGYRLGLVFQPHLFSRTRDLAEGFAVSIDKADTVVLLPVYPARELPVPGVTSELIRGHMRNTDVYLWNREELAEKLHILLPEEGADVPTVLVTAGAGDIDALLPELKNRIKTMYA
ncbi:MAG TPA: cyanophycin synthetase, partial [Lacibacter sp.]|nr:cyanophycin synthetase [Lacibacter sp.]